MTTRASEGLRKNLEKNIGWFALGLIVAGATLTGGFLAWLRSEVAEQVGNELRKPGTVVAVAQNPAFLQPLAGYLAANHAADLKGDKGDPGSELGTDGTFAIVELSKRRHTRDSPASAIQAFVDTGSQSELVLCQTVSAGSYPQFPLQVYCHRKTFGSNDGIYVHVESTTALPDDFSMSLLLLQVGASNYGTPIFGG